jgi:hypothetical protein
MKLLIMQSLYRRFLTKLEANLSSDHVDQPGSPLCLTLSSHINLSDVVLYLEVITKNKTEPWPSIVKCTGMGGGHCPERTVGMVKRTHNKTRVLPQTRTETLPDTSLAG